MYFNRLDNCSLEDLKKVPSWEATNLYHHGLYVYGTYAKDMDTLSKHTLAGKIVLLFYRLIGTSDEVSEEPGPFLSSLM